MVWHPHTVPCRLLRPHSALAAYTVSFCLCIYTSLHVYIHATTEQLKLLKMTGLIVTVLSFALSQLKEKNCFLNGEQWLIINVNISKKIINQSEEVMSLGFKYKILIDFKARNILKMMAFGIHQNFTQIVNSKCFVFLYHELTQEIKTL